MTDAVVTENMEDDSDIANAVKSQDVMTKLSAEIADLSPGDRAALRRIFLTKRHDADGVVIKTLHKIDKNILSYPNELPSWRLLMHVAALLAGTGRKPSHSRRSVGAALHAADYSENALLRLLAARGPMLHDQVRRAARRLAQKDKGPINLWTMLGLISSKISRVEEARLEIARGFYAAEAQSAEPQSKGDNK